MITFKQGSYYLLDDGTIGEAHCTGQSRVVEMTLFRTKEQLEEETELDIDSLEEPAFTYKGNDFFGNEDVYIVGQGRVVKKLNNLILKCN